MIEVTAFAVGLRIAGASTLHIFAGTPGELAWASRTYPDRVEPVQVPSGEWRATVSVECQGSIMLPIGSYRIEAIDGCEGRGLVTKEIVWSGPLDLNCDGVAGDDADIESLWQCLAGRCGEYASADFNHDGDSGVDSDIALFYELLAGHAE